MKKVEKPERQLPLVRQARRWLDNELRKPGHVTMCNADIAEFYEWAARPQDYVLTMMGS